MLRYFCLFAVIFLGCSKPGNKNAERMEEPTPVQDSNLSPVKPSIEVTLPEEEVTQISAYLVGYQEQLRLATTGDNKLVLPKANAGVYDLILLGLNKSNIEVGQRINGVQIVADQTSHIKNIRWSPLSTISGTIKTSQNSSTSAEELVVQVPGTHLISTVNSDGTYVLDNIPTGVHDLRISAPNYQDGSINLVEIPSDQSLELEDFYLSDETETGIYLGGTGSESGKIAFVLVPPKFSNKARISTYSDFRDSNWQNLKTSKWMKFDQAGEFTIYAQFSQDETNLSETFQIQINLIETQDGFLTLP